MPSDIGQNKSQVIDNSGKGTPKGPAESTLKHGLIYHPGIQVNVSLLVGLAFIRTHSLILSEKSHIGTLLGRTFWEKLH